MALRAALGSICRPSRNDPKLPPWYFGKSSDCKTSGSSVSCLARSWKNPRDLSDACIRNCSDPVRAKCKCVAFTVDDGIVACLRRGRRTFTAQSNVVHLAPNAIVCLLCTAREAYISGIELTMLYVSSHRRQTDRPHTIAHRRQTDRRVLRTAGARLEESSRPRRLTLSLRMAPSTSPGPPRTSSRAT